MSHRYVLDRRAQRRTALHLAAWAGHLDCVKALVAAGAQVGASLSSKSAWIAAADDKLVERLNCAKALVAAVALLPLLPGRLSGLLLVSAAACSKAHSHRRTAPTTPQISAAAQDEMTALHFAATKGNVEVIKFLLRPSEQFAH